MNNKGVLATALMYAGGPLSGEDHVYQIQTGCCACSVLFVLLMIMMPTAAFGAYAYNYGRTKDLNWADEGVYFAERAWYALGFSYNSYTAAYNSETMIKSNMDQGNGFYAYTHGNIDVFLDNIIVNNKGGVDYSDPGVVHRTEVSAARASDWKRLVFGDWCNSADNIYWAQAFGIATGDGSSHAYIGWDGTSLDSWEYSDWNNWFWWSVQYRDTIRDSAEYATYRQPAVPLTKWHIYGNGAWAY